MDGSATLSLSFDAAERISSAGYSYDECGNLISRPGQRLSYDELNRLTSVTDASTEATIAAYTYDEMNCRASATDASGTVLFHYDGASPDVMAETRPDGTLIASYVRDASGRPLFMERGAERYTYHVNARGDVEALSDADGDVVDSYAYDPWGRVLSATETVANPYRYAGYRYDCATGLYNLWNRYYDPESKRFITKDVYPGKTSAPGTMNGYAYCLGNPVGLVDTNGREPHGTGKASPSAGYLNIGSTAAYVIGGTAGVLIGSDGIYGYIGPAFGLSGGVSIVGSPMRPSEGWGSCVSGGCLIGVEAGLSPIDDGDIKWPDSWADLGGPDNGGDSDFYWACGLWGKLGASLNVPYTHKLIGW